MIKKSILLTLLALFNLAHLFAQVDITYQKPVKEILDLVDIEKAPNTLLNEKGNKMVFLYSDNFKTIEELSEKELRLAGLRINPIANIGSRVRYYNDITLMDVGEQEEIRATGLPVQKRLANFSWSPDQTKMAFTNTLSNGVELWILDIETAKASKLTEAQLNANFGTPYTWATDSKSLLVKFIPNDKKDLIDKSKAIPVGPRVSISEGTKAQNRTYQDLLKDKADEHNFEQLTRSEIYRVSLEGKKNLWKRAAMFSSLQFSPDGNYILVTTIHKPFSYIVPYYRFPSKTIIYTKQGKEVKKILETPLIEDLPKGFMATRKGKRSLQWRNDKPSTIVWVKALDKGNPKNNVAYRDEVFMLKAPFDGEGTSLVKTINRFRGITWGNDEIAFVADRWWNTRNTKTYLFNPSDNTVEPEIITDRNYQDNYSDPGSPVTKRNAFGKNVLLVDKNSIYLSGNGYSDEGIRPFIDKFNLKKKEAKRLWQANGISTLETITKLLDHQEGVIITRIESKNGFPNFYIRNIKSKKTPEQITFFENPFKSLQGVHKELIKYKRDDGIELSGVLYLPPGYDMQTKEKLPMIMWAYPREYKDKSSAGQVTSSPHQFTYPSYGSPIYWVMRGYVVLDRAAFPILGEKDEEPNDTFVPQLVANAKAAIDAVAELGFADRERVAVGGHSYGAFMTANLLSHSDLFAAGIARSGAYNRTLTPFGFQSEERTYWEAPEIYFQMSPFMHAHKMKHALLLIHGEADNNSGTYPLQSERYFNALKGHGANVRLVMLPNESHGYAAKESVLHVLWEQDQWLEKWVKNKSK